MKARHILFLIIFISNVVFGFSQSSENKKTATPSNFPSDCIVTEQCPSCRSADSLFFYPDRTFILVLGGIGDRQKHFELGIWRLEGQLVKMEIYKILGLRPIGEPINPDCQFASNPDDYCEYEEYVTYEQWVNKVKTFDKETLGYDDIKLDSEIRASQRKFNTHKYLLNGEYKDASCRRLTKDDLLDLSKGELRLMRNEIFARYGYEFKSNDLKEHFESFDWYKGYNSNVDEYLTRTEKDNIFLIREFEEK